MGRSEYVFCKPDVEKKVFEYLREAPKVYLKEYRNGQEDEIDSIILNSMRRRIQRDASQTEPIDLGRIYENMMTDNLERIKEAEAWANGEEVSSRDLIEWNAKIRAFLDIVGIIRTRRYDMQGTNFVKDGEYIVPSPVEMIEEQAEYYTHNNLIKRTSKQQHDIITTMFIMNSNIEGAIANMTTEQLDNFRGIMAMKKIAYEDALAQHNENSEYVNNVSRNVPSIIAERFGQCIWYQKEYNLDMVRKYGDAKDGLIAYVDNLDSHINHSIMGSYDF